MVLGQMHRHIHLATTSEGRTALDDPHRPIDCGLRSVDGV